MKTYSILSQKHLKKRKLLDYVKLEELSNRKVISRSREKKNKRKEWKVIKIMKNNSRDKAEKWENAFFNSGFIRKNIKDFKKTNENI